MITIWGENYYIDLDEVETYLELSEAKPTDEESKDELKINVVKFELVKMMFETILTEQEIPEDKLGLKNNQNDVSIAFKLAFNTLLNKKLINHY